jgi:hypothetical protein
MSLFPDPLVTVGWYGTAESGEDDKGKLDAAGVTAYLAASHRGGYIELRVPEGELQRAVEVLGIKPEDVLPEIEPSDSSVPKCPECGSDQARKLPPYAGYALLASAALTVLCLLLGHPAGIAFVFVGWFAAMWLSRYSQHFRCGTCGHVFQP